MGVTNVDAGTLAASWAAKMAAAGPRMQAGAQAVTTPPGQAAAAQKDAYLNGVNASVNLWAQKVAAVSTADWQNAYITKGLPRVASGAAAAQPKFATVLAKILSAEKSIVSSLPARGGLENNIARSAAFQRAMAATKGQFTA
jgi:hypothetical protein